jgi:hypothetical protein
MATLPQIESGRVQVAGVPGAQLPMVQMQQVDPVGFRAQAQEANTLSQILDRMSSNLFGESAKFMERAGAQYAAENAITDEQLQAAKRGDTTAIQMGGSTNVFDMALRKARSLELASHFEAEGRIQLTTLLNQVEDGKIGSADVTTKIKTMTDGLAKSLAPIDADAALKFRANMATYGSTVLKSAFDAEQKRAKAQRLAKFDKDFNGIMQLMEATVSQGFWVDDKGQQRSVDDLANTMRENVLTNSLLLGDAAVQKSYSDQFEAGLKNAKINGVTKLLMSDEYMNNPTATLKAINSGQVGKMSAVMQDLIKNDFDSVGKITAQFMTAVSQREKANKEVQDEKDRKALSEFIPVYNQAMSLPEGSPKRKQLIGQIAKMAEANPKMVPLGVLAELQKPNTEGNSMVEFNAMAQIYDGRITSAEQIYQLPGLNGKQKVNLLGKLVSEDRRNDSELDRGISRLAGIPVIPGQMVVIDPKGKEWERRLTLSAQAAEIKAKAVAEGKVLTNNDVLRQLETGIEQSRNTEKAKTARKQLDAYEKSDWVNGKITRDSLPTLERKAGNDRRKLNELNRIRNLLNDAEGN